MSDQAPRGSHGRRRYATDNIPDNSVDTAAMFARKVLREEALPGVASARAANHYGVGVSDVACHTGQAASEPCGVRRIGGPRSGGPARLLIRPR